jgi:hypothetical protein
MVNSRITAVSWHLVQKGGQLDYAGKVYRADAELPALHVTQHTARGKRMGIFSHIPLKAQPFRFHAVKLPLLWTFGQYLGIFQAAVAY